MSDKKQNENREGVALNPFSIQEITAIFSEIDEKIQSLHTCSLEDFLTLNAYFKKYYTDSKTISDNAKNLFNIITKEENRTSFFKQLHQFQDSLQGLLSAFDENHNEIIQVFDKMILEMEQMFVTANNLKQDLMTLKLLVTNFKLDVIIAADPTSKMVRKTNDFNELIIQTKSFFVEFYKNSNHFKDLLKSFETQLMQYKDHNIQIINELINEVNYSSSLLDQKYDEAIQLIPKLTDRTQSTSNSIAKIITNLQYQDIIRQKIEHIQQTHKEILKELNNIGDLGDENTQNETRVKCFVQIRDIAALQSAQLIHANKEYQKAIEVISSKFLEVGNDMTEISDLCHQIIGNGNTNRYSHFDVIREKFEKTAYLTELFQKSLEFSKEKITKQQNELEIIVNNYAELSDFIRTIDKSITRSIDNQSPRDVQKFETTTKQIRNILTEIQSINNHYNSQFNKIKDIHFSISDQNSEYSEETNMLKSKLDLFSSQYKEIINNLNQSNENIYQILNENQELSTRISVDIKTSIEQIKYYDFFDKVIEEIILKLNDINFKLQNIETAGEIEDGDTLNKLKQRYTMYSEHVIHDKLSTHHNIDLNHLESTGVEEDDDNLELF
jgi:hypothetical protein